VEALKGRNVDVLEFLPPQALVHLRVENEEQAPVAAPPDGAAEEPTEEPTKEPTEDPTGGQAEDAEGAEDARIINFLSPTHIYDTHRQNGERVLAMFRVPGVAKFEFEVVEVEQGKVTQEVRFSLWAVSSDDGDAGGWQRFSFSPVGQVDARASSCRIAGENVLLVLAKADNADWANLWQGQRPHKSTRTKKRGEKKKKTDKNKEAVDGCAGPYKPALALSPKSKSSQLSKQCFVDVNELD
jgi:hypothetical protein